jgi:serine/threonine-protein kinase
MAQQQQRYRVIEKIASGGMAEVFRAESAGLEGFKKTVAIKRVLPHLSEKKQFIGMFLDEARLSAHLSHSNCVQVFDIGVGDNTYFIVMEFVDGSDLKGIIEHSRKIGHSIPVEVACLICVRICEGLTYAHELEDGKGENLQIVHRDMSPPNVLLTRFGEVKIVDFGLAKANSQLEHSEPGIIKGKFSYLSPEAAQGLPIDARTDIFAVGIILWELLAGRRLFLGQSDLETVRMVQAARVPPIRQLNPKVSPELERVVARALAGDPSQRYQAARDFGYDLNQVLFTLGRPVSSFDLAQLVAPIWTERAQAKRGDKTDRGSLIGSLIDEALFEFTSLDEGERNSSASGAGAAPLNIGSFENVQDWARDISEIGLEVRQHEPAAQYELGNLAALEDEEARSRRGLSSRPPPAIDDEDEHEDEILPDVDAMPPKRSKAGWAALGVLLVLALAAAGAHFAGVIP